MRKASAAVTEADRDAAAAQLREHYAAGRLSLDEFQDRLDAVYRAQDSRELGVATDSLPHTGVVIPPGASWGGHAGGAHPAADYPAAGYPAGGYARGGYPLHVAELRASAARVGRRIMLAAGLLTAGAFLVLALLITAFVVHGGVAGVVAGVLLAILAMGVAAVAAVVWLARRLWLRHAWIEVVPLAIGQPWLSRVARMARLLLTGHALWRLRTRLASRGA